MQFISKSKIAPNGEIEFEVSFSKDNGEIIRRVISFDDYIALLKTSRVEEKMNLIQIPILPKEIVECEMDVNDNSTFKATVVYPAKKRRLHLNGTSYMIPFPALVAKIVVNKGIRQNTLLYCADSDNPKKGDPLYCYPFGNCNREGTCCYGNIASKAKGPAEAVDILDDFLLGATNNDLYFKQNTLNLPQKELAESLVDLKEFPKDLLMKNGKFF